MPIRIRCAVCDRPAADVTVETVICDEGQTISVRCNGQVDRMALSYAEMKDWPPDVARQWTAIGRGEVEGIAFATPQLLPTPGKEG